MKDVFDTLLRSVIVLFMLFGAVAFLFGCASAPPAAHPVAAKEPLAHAADPIAAIVVTSCNKSVALYVVMDNQHMIRFNGAGTALFDAIGPGVAPKETHADPVDWNAAFALAQRAPLTSHVIMPCGETV